MSKKVDFEKLVTHFFVRIGWKFPILYIPMVPLCGQNFSQIGKHGGDLWRYYFATGLKTEQRVSRSNTAITHHDLVRTSWDFCHIKAPWIWTGGQIFSPFGQKKILPIFRNPTFLANFGIFPALEKFSMNSAIFIHFSVKLSVFTFFCQFFENSKIRILGYGWGLFFKNSLLRPKWYQRDRSGVKVFSLNWSLFCTLPKIKAPPQSQIAGCQSWRRYWSDFEKKCNFSTNGFHRKPFGVL